MLWQCMLMVCPDVVWAILFSCAFGALVFYGPVVSSHQCIASQKLLCPASTPHPTLYHHIHK